MALDDGLELIAVIDMDALGGCWRNEKEHLRRTSGGNLKVYGDVLPVWLDDKDVRSAQSERRLNGRTDLSTLEVLDNRHEEFDSIAVGDRSHN